MQIINSIRKSFADLMKIIEDYPQTKSKDDNKDKEEMTMTNDKKNISDEEFVEGIKGRPGRLGRIRSKQIVGSLGRDPAEMMAELEKTIEEERKEMPYDLEIEKDRFGRIKFIITEKKKEEDNKPE